MDSATLDLMNEQYADSIQYKNLQKILPSIISDIEIVPTRDLLKESIATDMILPSKNERAVVSLKKKVVYGFCGKSSNFIDNRDLFLPILSALGKRYGKQNVHVSLRDFGNSKFVLQIVIASDEVQSVDLASHYSFEKAYPSIRLVNTYNNDFKPYYTVGYSFMEDTFYPYYNTHKELKFYKNVPVNNTNIKASDVDNVESFVEKIIYLLEHQTGQSLEDLKTLWQHQINELSINDWIGKTTISDHKDFRKKKVKDIVIKTVRLGSQRRYKKRCSLGLLHKSINVCFGTGDLIKMGNPKNVENIDEYFVTPLIENINNGQG